VLGYNCKSIISRLKIVSALCSLIYFQCYSNSRLTLWSKRIGHLCSHQQYSCFSILTVFFFFNFDGYFITVLIRQLFLRNKNFNNFTRWRQTLTTQTVLCLRMVNNRIYVNSNPKKLKLFEFFFKFQNNVSLWIMKIML
jgi:hypothetical protein